MISRRNLLSSVFGTVLAGAALPVPVLEAAKKKKSKRHPAVRQMQKIADELIAAQKTGTISSFSAVIQRHADVHDIANYSLGRYRKSLPKSKRNAYYRGVRKFMARYFATNSKRYRVAKATISPDVTKDGDAVFVDTKVRLTSGTSYNIRWRLAKRRGVYKVVDVKVLFISLVSQQRVLFYRFLSQKNGDVNALVLALNR